MEKSSRWQRFSSYSYSMQVECMYSTAVSGKDMYDKLGYMLSTQAMNLSTSLLYSKCLNVGTHLGLPSSIQSCIETSTQSGGFSATLK